MRVRVDDGVELAVEVAGSGPGLLLVHGFGGAKEDWCDHVEALASDHTVVTFDHRGHGASDKPDAVSQYSFDRLAADTLAVADAVGIERFRLLGHSMGGMVARGIALQHPQRVEALVMMDTTPGPIPNFDPALLDLGAQIALEQGKDALKAALEAAAPLENPANQRLLAERPGYQEFNDKKWNDLSPVMWAALARAIAYQGDDLEAMRTLQMPVLVLVGELDKPLVKPSRAMAEAIPGAQLVIIADAGHSPQFENAAAWLHAMTEFLASVTLAAA